MEVNYGNSVILQFLLSLSTLCDAFSYFYLNSVYSNSIELLSELGEMVSAKIPGRAEVLSLFRSLLRTAPQFSDYNMREYTKRRTIDAFRHNCHLPDQSSIASAFSDGKAQLDVAKRQAIVYSLYAPNPKSVMDFNP